MAGLTISGVASLKARLKRARTRGRDVIQKATAEVIDLLYEKSQDILDKEVYSKSRKPFEEAPDKSDQESLYQHFKLRLAEISATVAEGKLGNDSDHALFIEDGTDDEGTGKHFVPVGATGYLAWMDGTTGEIVFDRKGHEVKGIKPLRFLARSLTENRTAVVAIYRKHYKGLFK